MRIISRFRECGQRQTRTITEIGKFRRILLHLSEGVLQFRGQAAGPPPRHNPADGNPPQYPGLCRSSQRSNRHQRTRRILRLRRSTTINKRMMWRDTDNATPRPFADKQSQLHQFETVRENIAIGTRVLIGDSNHRTQDGSVWIRVWCPPAWYVIPNAATPLTSLKAAVKHAHLHCSVHQPAVQG